MRVTTIIPNPTWGKTLEILQEKGSIRIDTNSSETFKSLLNSISLKYTVSDDLDTKLTRFTLSE
jgi:hypothetical protein